MPSQAETPAQQSVSYGLRKLWLDPDAFAFNLLVAFIDCYGIKAIAGDPKTGEEPWSPEVIQMELEDDFRCEVPAAVFDRLMTAIDILTTNSFFRSPIDFSRDCVSLAGHFVSADTFVLPDSEDLAWGMTEGLLISPPDGEDAIFSPEVAGLIRKTLADEGILTPPDVLAMAGLDQEIADRVSYDFSDDPDMFAGIQQMQADKTAAINQAIKSRMARLLEQLESLPLKNGKLDAVAKIRRRFAGE